MRAEDIVEALQENLPNLVDDFTTQNAISSIGINSGWDGTRTILQITTSNEHGLTNGKSVYLKNVYSPIDISSFTRNGILGTVTTTQRHDLTTGSQDTINIQDANELEFNGDFNLYKVADRHTFTVIMDDSGATTATGSMVSYNIGSYLSDIAGLQTISSVNSATTFLYEVGIEVSQVVNESGVVNAEPRISASISLERFIESYTKQDENEGWLCVVVGDSTANKSRHQDIDSTDNLQRTQFFNQKFAQIVEVFAVFPTVGEIAGRNVKDRCEELLQPICQCILFRKFDSLMTAGEFNPLQFTGAGFAQYNTAYYAHRYSFEMTVQMQFSDTAGYYEKDVAFRDIDMTQTFSTGNETMTTDIDLDEDAS